MPKEYRTIQEVAGPLMLVHGVENVTYDELGEIELASGEVRRCKVLEINGVGYRGAKQGKKLVLNLGYSHPVEIADPEGIETVMEGQNKIIIKGIDKEKVGQFAAEIRTKREPEPYKGKGIKYADETIRRKVGKTGKK
mgnify:CR=1 FL=1